MSKILIIEDDEDLKEGLEFSLKMDGYEVQSVTTKKDGLTFIKRNNYDLILLDCNLPDGSGYDLCTEVKNYREVPVFMLTARNTEMDEVKALELGVADFMSKPFSLAVLKARMRKILQNTKSNSRLVTGGIVIDKDECKVYKKDERSLKLYYVSGEDLKPIYYDEKKKEFTDKDYSGTISCSSFYYDSEEI